MCRVSRLSNGGFPKLLRGLGTRQVDWWIEPLAFLQMTLEVDIEEMTLSVGEFSREACQVFVVVRC